MYAGAVAPGALSAPEGLFQCVRDFLKDIFSVDTAVDLGIALAVVCGHWYIDNPYGIVISFDRWCGRSARMAVAAIIAAAVAAVTVTAIACAVVAGIAAIRDGTAFCAAGSIAIAAAAA